MITSESYAAKIYPEAVAASGERQRAHSRQSFLRIIPLFRLTADFLLCVAVTFAATTLPLYIGHAATQTLHKPLSISIVTGLFAVVLLHRNRAYNQGTSHPVHETASAIQMSVQSLLLILPTNFLLHLALPLSAIVPAFALMPPLLLLQRQLLSAILQDHRSTRIERTEPHWLYALSKRTLDLAVSSLLLLLLSPALLLIALLIRLSSPGPALFVQRRAGRNGVLFNMYKFRSMSRTAQHYAYSPTTSTDPRITRLGRLLRRNSLDELPQLINVFLGEMSLVGPRPEMPFIVHRYSPHQRQRLQVLPGITGLWQLSSDRAFPIHENLHHDLFYIRHRTLSMDLAILIHTLFFAMRGGV